MLTLLLIFVFAAALPVIAAFVIHHYLVKDEEWAKANDSK